MSAEETTPETGDPMLEHVGNVLRGRRIAQGMSLAEVSRSTKIKERSLELLEAGRFTDLPALVFLQGYVAAYARCVGISEPEAKALLKRDLARAGVGASAAALPTPPSQSEWAMAVASRQARTPASENEAGEAAPRYRVVLMVFLFVVMATLTLSLLMRQAPPLGGGLS